MIDRLGQRMTDFVGTTGAKVLRATEGVVPGIEPARHRRLTPGRVVLAVGAAAAALATKPLREVLERSGSADDERAGGSGARATELAGKTRAELYELAQKSDIEGRSAMSKDELVEALKKATPS